MLYLIDLFCGSGGFSTGAVQAGAKVILAVDLWEEALNVHKDNHPTAIHSTIELGKETKKITELIQNTISLIKNLKKTDIIHLHASPPCQNLSLMNKLRNEDIGLGLTKWTFKFINELTSKKIINSWTIEQVNNKQFREFLEKTQKSDKIKFHYQVLQMKLYKICQNRERIIVSSKEFKLIEQKLIPMKSLINIPFEFMESSGSKAHEFFRDKTDIAYTIISTPHYLCDNNKQRIRAMNTEEMMKFQTYPSTYNFSSCKNKTDVTKMIANSVPCSIAEQIILAIQK